MINESVNNNKTKPRKNLIIPIIWDRLRQVYIIEVAESILANFQKTIIDGAAQENIGVFFAFEEKQIPAEESIAKAAETAKKILEKEKQLPRLPKDGEK